MPTGVNQMAKTTAVKAAADARTVLRQFKSLYQLAEAVEDLGDLEAAAHDVQQAVDKATAEFSKVNAKAMDAKIECEKAEDAAEAAETRRANVEKEIASLISAAEADAKQAAQKIIEDAHIQAAEARFAIEAEQDAHKAWMVDAGKEADKMQRELQKLEKAVSEIRAKFN